MAFNFYLAAYGSYNDNVLRIVGARQQSAVTWDFECAYIHPFQNDTEHFPALVLAMLRA